MKTATSKARLDAWRKLIGRIEKAVNKSGRDISKISNEQLRRILIEAKVMNHQLFFVDENGNVVPPL